MNIQATFFGRLLVCAIFWLRSIFSPIQRAFAVSPSVIITEVEYDAVQTWTDTDYEWFELFNPTSGTVSLSGWTIQDNQFSYLFWSAISLWAGGYLLVANNTWFSVNYTSVTPNITIFPTTRLPLANAWDYLLLKNELWTDIDQVTWPTYWSASAWTSLCRINSTDTDSAWDWMSNCVVTPWSGGYSFASPDTTPPVIVLLGSGAISIQQNSDYVELGADWSDLVDGTGHISTPTSGLVNTWVVGVYLLEYTYTDNAWNTGNIVTRTVTVTDIDECVLATDNCNANATCTNTMWSFSCACNTWYSWDWITCTDIDECVLATDNCDVNADCTNTLWSFSCSCTSWYSGDGVTCTLLVCDPWLYLSGSSCILCSPGSFNALSGATSCMSCPWGMISSTWATSCLACDAWTYATGNSCVSCASGSVSNTWATSCTLCAAGTYASGDSCMSCNPWSYSDTWATSCTMCAPGTEQASSGATSCDVCAPGRISMTWASVCTPCDLWTYGSGNECISCGEGTFSDQTWMTSCSACPWGTYQSGTGALYCLTCDPWTYSDTWAISCTQCLPWTYQSDTWAISCESCASGTVSGTWATSCTLCAAGTYATGNSCESCGSGSVSSTWATSCTLCAAGTYASGDSCVTCNPWSYSDTWAISCTLCAPGSYVLESGSSSCNVCAVGTYQPSSGDHACLQCAPWTYQDGTWAIACTQCLPWTYQSGYQSVSCESCPEWTISSTWASLCTPCGEGTYASGNSCLSCAVGTFNATSWATTCTECEAWKFMSTTGAFTCTLCSPWTYSSTGAVACEQCPANTYQPYAWSVTCLACPSGWISGTWSMVCNFCPSGTYRVWETCVPNPPSWWASSSIQTTSVYTISTTNENESPQSLPWEENESSSSDITDPLVATEVEEENDALQEEDQESLDAYTWAKKFGITTQDSFEKARMYETLTRGELAKMVTNFSRQVIGLEYRADPKCTASVFADYTQRDDELSSYIEQSCSLGLMGRRNDSSWTIEKFRAYDLVTRAEFATVMSRLLFGSRYNGDGTQQRYISHLNAMKEAWYINLIDNPLFIEIRWFAMIVMMRIDQTN